MHLFLTQYFFCKCNSTFFWCKDHVNPIHSELQHADGWLVTIIFFLCFRKWHLKLFCCGLFEVCTYNNGLHTCVAVICTSEHARTYMQVCPKCFWNTSNYFEIPLPQHAQWIYSRAIIGVNQICCVAGHQVVKNLAWVVEYPHTQTTLHAFGQQRVSVAHGQRSTSMRSVVAFHDA